MKVKTSNGIVIRIMESIEFLAYKLSVPITDHYPDITNKIDGIQLRPKSRYNSTNPYFINPYFIVYASA